MRASKAIGIALLGVSVLPLLWLLREPHLLPMGRGVRPLGQFAGSPPARFDVEQSAGLFVGVSHFKDHTLADVEYAVDDAVDLAYAFSMTSHSRLVPARRVVLVLTGKPKKEESKQRLKRLEKAGARVLHERADVEPLLQQQADLAGPEGALIVAFATHGFSVDGVPYVLTANSVFSDAGTSLSAARLLEIAATSRVARSLVFIDACRERVKRNARAGEAEPLAEASLLAAMRPVQGQAVFYAAAAGQYAYDDDRIKNGVFTAAVLGGLQCQGAHPGGLVTVEALHDFVERSVRKWILEHRHQAIGSATQVNLDGRTSRMPLASCSPLLEPPPPAPSVRRATVRGRTIEAFSDAGTRLWTRDLHGAVVGPEVVDVDGDGRNEVVAGVGRGGDESGTVMALDGAGRVRWSVPTGPGLAVRALAPTRLRGLKGRQIVALSNPDDRRAPSLVTAIGADGTIVSSYSHPGELLQLLVDAPTAAHWPKIIILARNRALGAPGVFALNARNVSGSAPGSRAPFTRGSQLWYGLVEQGPVRRLEVIDQDNDGIRDIVVRLADGEALYLDFLKGATDTSGAGFKLLRR